jgi:hypothetical protein
MPDPDYNLEKALHFEERARKARTDHDRRRYQAAARHYRALLAEARERGTAPPTPEPPKKR